MMIEEINEQPQQQPKEERCNIWPLLGCGLVFLGILAFLAWPLDCYPSRENDVVRLIRQLDAKGVLHWDGYRSDEDSCGYIQSAPYVPFRSIRIGPYGRTDIVTTAGRSRTFYNPRSVLLYQRVLFRAECAERKEHRDAKRRAINEFFAEVLAKSLCAEKEK